MEPLRNDFFITQSLRNFFITQSLRNFSLRNFSLRNFSLRNFFITQSLRNFFVTLLKSLRNFGLITPILPYRTVAILNGLHPGTGHCDYP